MNVAVIVTASGIKVIRLTGAKGGEVAVTVNVTVKVSETETYII